MESISRHNPPQSIHPIEVLPDDRGNWPHDAEQSYSQVLKELDRWSREHGFSTVTNSCIAEEAIRQSW